MIRKSENKNFITTLLFHVIYFYVLICKHQVNIEKDCINDCDGFTAAGQRALA